MSRNVVSLYNVKLYPNKQLFQGHPNPWQICSVCGRKILKIMRWGLCSFSINTANYFIITSFNHIVSAPFVGLIAKHRKNVRYCVDSYIVAVITSCGAQEFTCSNQQCVSVTKICDLQSDCQDGSDEDAENCGTCSSIRDHYSQSWCLLLNFMCPS